MGKRGAGKKPNQSQLSTSKRLPPLGKGPIKRTPQHEFDHQDNPDNIYDVDSIRAERKVKIDGVVIEQWLIRWKGFTEAHDTWEPIENLAGLEDDIAKFRKVRDEQVSLKLGKRKRKTPVNSEAPVSIPSVSGSGGSASGGSSGGSGAEDVLADGTTQDDEEDTEVLRPAMRGRRTAKVMFILCDLPTCFQP